MPLRFARLKKPDSEKRESEKPESAQGTQEHRLPSRAKLSLSSMLSIPFMLQALPLVGAIGYLSHRNSEATVADLTHQMIASKAQRVEQTLSTYLNSPLLANRLIRDAVARGEVSLDLSRQDKNRDRFLLEQMRLFSQFTWISLGSEANDSAGVWRPGPGQPLQINFSNRSSQYFGVYSATNPQQNQRAQQLKIERPAFYPRTRPWYRAVAHAKQGRWVDVYAGFTPGTIFIAASEPLYDSAGKFVGVSGIDLSLNNIQTFLQQNPVSLTGQTFIIERSGLLVASSTTDRAFRLSPHQKPHRINVLEGQNSLTQAAARALQRKNPKLAQLTTPQYFRFEHDHQQNFAQVLPFQLAGGLDWLIVTIVPEEDVMGQIQAGNRTTAMLTGGALLLAIALNILISRWLVRPISELVLASRRIAQGNFNQPVQSNRVKELSILAGSFNQMSQELQQSRQQLEDYSHALEDRIRERTQELEAEVERRRQTEAALQTANVELQRLAFVDGLTQLANRRCFDERLAQEWQRLKRDQLPLALILCDVDYFKRYNDTYGHQAGDLCLQNVARVLQAAAMRSSDLAARYGGEEFALLLPNTPVDGAITVAQKIQTLVHQLAIPHRQSATSEFVTLSLGITVLFPAEADHPEMLLAQADHALYQSKQAGRDRYSIYNADSLDPELGSLESTEHQTQRLNDS
jgi:diguanylate cyclase (GGDEF)-like protein